ncbi:hypothetical protein THTE_4438 [Thermogutta terrifontis]|uniref:Uncharacterized protein n=1 Tax=Thermogutta terrifontis TaxID=1331910 RepID=A0A286RM39_9BACT|nr:hypothetical protein [Thermogutta terrifontis]ASV77039.1 hypothetical protein THTE_4438 [Thermogutta terrifontis]
MRIPGGGNWRHSSAISAQGVLVFRIVRRHVDEVVFSRAEAELGLPN